MYRGVVLLEMFYNAACNGLYIFKIEFDTGFSPRLITRKNCCDIVVFEHGEVMSRKVMTINKGILS